MMNRPRWTRPSFKTGPMILTLLMMTLFSFPLFVFPLFLHACSLSSPSSRVRFNRRYIHYVDQLCRPTMSIHYAHPPAIHRRTWTPTGTHAGKRTAQTTEHTYKSKKRTFITCQSIGCSDFVSIEYKTMSWENDGSFGKRFESAGNSIYQVSDCFNTFFIRRPITYRQMLTTCLVLPSHR